MSLTYREDYWDSPALKAEFIRFLKQMHGVDLSSWNEMGFWDRRYRPFSFFDGDSLISSVCVYSMNMIVDGKPQLAAQISAVGTLPDYRRRGLSFELTKKALDWARNNHDFFYLFADRGAFSFYNKCGFRPAAEYKTQISVSGRAARPGVIKLDVQKKDDLTQICRFASNRVPVSDVLGVSNKKLLMFWLLNSLKDHIYHVPELDILVLYKTADGRTTIFDIIGTRIPSFSRIYPYICGVNDRIIEFLFMTDKLDLKNADKIRIEDNGAHIMGDFSLEENRFIFPFTAQA